MPKQALDSEGRRTQWNETTGAFSHIDTQGLTAQGLREVLRRGRLTTRRFFRGAPFQGVRGPVRPEDGGTARVMLAGPGRSGLLNA